MEDYMREALISFIGDDGKLLGELGVTQKAGAGIVFEIQTPEVFASSAITTTIAIESNVEFQCTIEDNPDWITATVIPEGISLSLDENEDEHERSARITFTRAGKDRLLGYLDIRQRGISYTVKLNGEPLGSIQEAMDMLPGMSDSILSQSLYFLTEPPSMCRLPSKDRESPRKPLYGA